MIMSRRPRSVWKVDSYASWQASENSGLSRCRETCDENLLRASVFRPAIPYLESLLALRIQTVDVMIG
jgi:hypothetical protein